MKSPFSRLGFVIGSVVCLFSSPLRAQSADIVLSGVTVSSSATEVLLIQSSTGAGRWVKIGQSFAGYTAKAYDPQTGQLTLTKGETSTVLTLKKSSVQVAVPTPPTPEQEKQINNNLRQLSAAADQYFLENGVSKVTVGQLVGLEVGKYIKVMNPAAGESYPSSMVIELGKPIKIKTASGAEFSYGN